MSGRFDLPRLSKQSVALLSIGKFPGGFPCFSRKSLQPLVERYGVLSSIAFGRHERLLDPLLAAGKSAAPAPPCR
jgi:hypothetical protein